MAKKNERIIKTFKILAKFADEVLCPSNAIDARSFAEDVDVRLETLDGKVCIPRFVATWNNGDGRYDAEFDDFCQRHFGIPFKAVRSVWISRLGRVDDYWHWIRLKQI